MGDTNNIYNSGEYLIHNPTWGREDSLWKVKEIFKTLPDGFLSGNFSATGIKVADIGCGGGGVIGNFARMLKEKGCTVDSAVGFDVTDTPLTAAKKEWKEIEFVKGDISDSGRYFDIGLLIDVVEHVEKPDEFVRRAAAHCRYLIFHIPLDDNYNFKLRRRYEYLVKTFGHIHYFNAGSCLEFLKGAGVKVIASRYTPGFMLPSSMVHLPAKLAFVPRLIAYIVSKPLSARLLGGYSLMVVGESELFRGTDRIVVARIAS